MLSFRPMPGLTLAMLVALAILGSLGTWQLQRLAWKLDLIENVERRIHQVPSPLDEALNSSLDVSYRPVAVEGVFDHTREVHLFGRNLEGYVGYFVFTPLLRTGAAPVLVNRGYVPPHLKEISSRPETLVQGRQAIEGLARVPDLGGWATPAPNLETNEWFARDVVQMAAHLDLEGGVPIYVEAFGSEGELPQGGQTRLQFKNDHFGYALTWYGLAIVMLGVYIALHIRAGRLGRPSKGT